MTEHVPTDEPATIIQEAIAGLSQESATGELAELLQILSEEMSDEHAVEKEFPNHIPSARWLVCGWYGQDPDVARWTAALALARAVLGKPNPNMA